jgi:hypothetical protein
LASKIAPPVAWLPPMRAAGIGANIPGTHVMNRPGTHVMNRCRYTRDELTPQNPRYTRGERLSREVSTRSNPTWAAGSAARKQRRGSPEGPRWHSKARFTGKSPGTAVLSVRFTPCSGRPVHARADFPVHRPNKARCMRHDCLGFPVHTSSVRSACFTFRSGLRRLAS